MSGAAPRFVVRRIVVAVDASPPSIEALDAAAELAARMQAELLGLFVEDINLLRLARLPFARQVSRFSGALAPVEEADLEAEIRALSAQARQALVEAGERRQLKATFRAVRGSVSAEVVAAAEEGDLLILGWGARPLSHHPRLGGIARAAARQSGKPVLLVRPGLDLARLVVVYEASAGADRALAVALSLAEAVGGEIEVLVAAPSADDGARLCEKAQAQLRERAVPARVRSLAGSADETLQAALREVKQGLLVLSADSSVLGPDTTSGVLEGSGRSVLLVR